jgi:hypothetical protein
MIHPSHVCNRHKSTTSKKEKRGVTRIDEALKLAKGGES